MASKTKNAKKKKPELSLILPTYNEAKNIRPVIEELESFFEKRKKAFEIVVVDDSSPDGTADAVEKLQKKFSNIVLLRDCKKEGIGRALERGYNAASGEWLLSMDADCAFRTNEISRFLEEAAKGFDLVTGSKYLRESRYEKESMWAWLKSKISQYGNFYISIVTGVPLHDFSMNFRLLKRSVWKSIHPTEPENFFLVEMLVEAHRKGFKIKEVGVTLMPRQYGHSKTRVWKQSVRFFSKATQFLWKK